jgi:hypothetical protein
VFTKKEGPDVIRVLPRERNIYVPMAAINGSVYLVTVWASANISDCAQNVNNVVVSTPVSLMAVFLKQRRRTLSARHAFLLLTDYHALVRYE